MGYTFHEYITGISVQRDRKTKMSVLHFNRQSSRLFWFVASWQIVSAAETVDDQLLCVQCNPEAYLFALKQSLLQLKISTALQRSMQIIEYGYLFSPLSLSTTFVEATVRACECISTTVKTMYSSTGLYGIWEGERRNCEFLKRGLSRKRTE